MNLKEAYPGSLGRVHFFSYLPRDAVIVRDLAVSASKLCSYACYLERLMTLETEKGNLIKAGSSRDSQRYVVFRETAYRLSYENKNIPFTDFYLACDL